METISFRLPLLKTSQPSNRKLTRECPRWNKHKETLNRRKEEQNNEENHFKFRIVVNSQKAAIHERETGKKHVEKSFPNPTPYRLTEQVPLIQKKYLQLRPLRHTEIRERKCPGVAFCRGCRNHEHLPWLHKNHQEHVQRIGGGYLYRPSEESISKISLKSNKLPANEDVSESKKVSQKMNDVQQPIAIPSSLSSSLSNQQDKNDEHINKSNTVGRTMSLQTDYSLLQNDTEKPPSPIWSNDSLEGFQTPGISSTRISSILSGRSTAINCFKDEDNISQRNSTFPNKEIDSRANYFNATFSSQSSRLNISSFRNSEKQSITDSVGSTNIEKSSVENVVQNEAQTVLETLNRAEFIDSAYKSFDVMDRFMDDVEADIVFEDELLQNCDQDQPFDDFQDELTRRTISQISDEEDFENIRYAGSVVSTQSLNRESYSQISKEFNSSCDSGRDESYYSSRIQSRKSLLDLGGNTPLDENLTNKIAMWTTEGFENEDWEVDNDFDDFNEFERSESYDLKLPKIESSSNLITSITADDYQRSTILVSNPLRSPKQNLENCNSAGSERDGEISRSSGSCISSSSTSIQDGNESDTSKSESDSSNSSSTRNTFPPLSSLTKGESPTETFRRSIKDMVRFPIIASRMSVAANNRKKNLQKPKLRKHLPQDALSRFNGKERHDSDSITTDSDAESDFDIPMMDFAAQHCIISYENLRKYEKLFNAYAKETDITKNVYLGNTDNNNENIQSLELDDNHQSNASESKKAIYKRNKEKIIESRDLERCLKRLGKDFKPLELEFIKRMMQLRGKEEKLSFKTFSIVAALTERITSLDSSIKQYCEELDLRTLERKLDKCKELYLLLLGKNSYSYHDMSNPFFIPLDALNTELEAGNITHSDRQSVIEKLYENENVNFLDFVMYIPLFLVIHERIVNRPIT